MVLTRFALIALLAASSISCSAVQNLADQNKDKKEDGAAATTKDEKPAEETKSDEAKSDIRALDRQIALRVAAAIARYASTAAGNVRQLQGIDPPEFRLRVGDWRVRFRCDDESIVILRVRHRREAYR